MLFPMQNIVDSLQTRTGKPFAIELPDGSHYRTGLGEPVFTVMFRSDAEGDFGAALAAGMLRLYQKCVLRA